MRLTALTLIGAVGLAVTAMSASAAPIVPPTDVGEAPGIVKVWGGCGPDRHPVPGHWSQWRGWVPPHCAPNRSYRPYAGWQYRHWGWRHHRDYYYGGSY